MTCRKVALAAFMLLVWPTMGSAQQVTCTAAPNPLGLLSTVASPPDRLGDKAYDRVMGEVRNGWAAAPAPFVKVTVSFEGQRGDDLGITRAAYVNGTGRRLKRSHIVTDTVLE